MVRPMYSRSSMGVLQRTPRQCTGIRISEPPRSGRMIAPNDSHAGPERFLTGLMQRRGPRPKPQQKPEGGTGVAKRCLLICRLACVWSAARRGERLVVDPTAAGGAAATAARLVIRRGPREATSTRDTCVLRTVGAVNAPPLEVVQCQSPSLYPRS